jgi:hypothetical protein
MWCHPSGGVCLLIALISDRGMGWMAYMVRPAGGEAEGQGGSHGYRT